MHLSAICPRPKTFGPYAWELRRVISSIPKAMRKQVRESRECFPLRRAARQTVIEPNVKNQRSPRGIANCPQISGRIAANKWLSEMPDLARERKSMQEGMRYG